jgi:hypothetical protein
MRTGPLRRLPIGIVADAVSADDAVVVHAVNVEWGQASASALVCLERDEGARFVKAPSAPVLWLSV